MQNNSKPRLFISSFLLAAYFVLTFHIELVHLNLFDQAKNKAKTDKQIVIIQNDIIPCIACLSLGKDIVKIQTSPIHTCLNNCQNFYWFTENYKTTFKHFTNYLRAPPVIPV